jgi:dipeptidyl aminopeptidase/acylaminoacyl peptidase
MNGTRRTAPSPWSAACPFALLLLLMLNPSLPAETAYQKPPKPILDALDAPPAPVVSLSPTRDRLLLVQGVRYPPVSDLAQPMVRLAGLRINPKTNGPHLPARYVGLTLQTLADGKQTRVEVPDNALLGLPAWSPDGGRFAFTNTTDKGVELWLGDARTGAVHRVDGVALNAAYGDPVDWLPDGQTLLCHTVVSDRGDPPPAPAVPKGPTVQESSGKAGPVRTFQDLLASPHDEDLFEYYASSQLVLVGVDGKATPLGKPALFAAAEPSPDGKLLLVVRTHRPFSYLYPAGAFPKDVEVWDRSGKVVYKLASLPLADKVPIEGVPTGPRSAHWRPTEPATLAWVEALDEGDPKKKVPARDRLLQLAAPFTGEPVQVAKTQHRFAGLTWGEKDGLALVRDYDRDRRWSRTYAIKADRPDQEPRLLWDRSVQDRYGDPGTPLLRPLPNGHRVLWQQGDALLLAGEGATPKGSRPFLDRFDLTTQKSERLFRSDEEGYEQVVALVSDKGPRFLTRHESPKDPPNYLLRSAAETGSKALTDFKDPQPQLRGITKKLVTYKRADGVPLSFTLYLPPDHKEGQRLPTVIWAYPREFNDADTAGQVAGSDQRFTTLAGPSHLFFLLQGYAVLDDAALPVVGDPETANNTYLDQVVAGAKAAIDKAVELGVTDRDRVGVGGHSYGAFMTANLLAHCDLFKAGVARSGAYNRTLTPFGFQSERRTLWEAPDVYLKLSPFMYADKIKAPLLLIHGEADNNPGTFPMQSERLFQAIRGNGGTVRYVVLPFESHGYTARESVEHTLYEMIAWFDK